VDAVALAVADGVEVADEDEVEVGVVDGVAGAAPATPEPSPARSS
jgi:hypothetical protein